MKLLRVVDIAELGPALRRIREAKGMSQGKVGKMGGLSASSISKAELKATSVNTEALLGVAKGLGLIIVLDPLNLLYYDELNVAMSQFGGQLLDGPSTPASDVREDR